jgi:hypothetical protein
MLGLSDSTKVSDHHHLSSHRVYDPGERLACAKPRCLTCTPSRWPHCSTLWRVASFVSTTGLDQIVAGSQVFVGGLGFALEERPERASLACVSSSPPSLPFPLVSSTSVLDHNPPMRQVFGITCMHAHPLAPSFKGVFIRGDEHVKI